MRLSTVAFSLLALGVASASAASASSSDSLVAGQKIVARDFERKLAVRTPKKHSSKRGDQLFTDAELTWYGGGQLDNPACGGSTPSSEDHVVAVNQDGPFKCGDTVHIHYNNKMSAAKVVDYCSGCAKHHLDLTEGLFKTFGSLDVGVMKNAHVKLLAKD